MKRLKNYGLWLSIFAFIPILFDGLKIYDFHGVLPNNYDALVKGFLGILVLLGIVNNPDTENRGFFDDKNK